MECGFFGFCKIYCTTKKLDMLLHIELKIEN